MSRSICALNQNGGGITGCKIKTKLTTTLPKPTRYYRLLYTLFASAVLLLLHFNDRYNINHGDGVGIANKNLLISCLQVSRIILRSTETFITNDNTRPSCVYLTYITCQMHLLAYVYSSFVTK